MSARGFGETILRRRHLDTGECLPERNPFPLASPSRRQTRAVRLKPGRRGQVLCRDFRARRIPQLYPSPIARMNTLTRRSFLKTSTVVASAGLATSARSTAARAAPAGVNDAIRIAIIDLGIMGRGHVKRLAGRKDVRLVALCDVDPSGITRALKEAEPNRIALFTCTDARDIMSRPDVDVIIIASGHHWVVAMDQVKASASAWWRTAKADTSRDSSAAPRMIRRARSSRNSSATAVGATWTISSTPC